MQQAQHYFDGLGRDEDPDGRSRKHLRIAMRRLNPVQEYTRLQRHGQALIHIIVNTQARKNDAVRAGDAAMVAELTAALQRLNDREDEIWDELQRIKPAAFSYGLRHPAAADHDTMEDMYESLVGQAAPLLSEEVRGTEYYRQQNFYPGFHNEALFPAGEDDLMYRVTRNRGIVDDDSDTTQESSD